MDINKIKGSLEILKENLGDGLMAADIWIEGTGQSIASFQGGNQKATALFDQITGSISKALKLADFPSIDPYYLFHLEDGMLVVVLLQDKYQWGILINPEKAPLGLVLNIAIPGVVESLK